MDLWKAVWRNGLWVKMWDLDVRGRVIKEMFVGAQYHLMGNVPRV